MIDMEEKRKVSNWTKVLIVLCVLALLLANPLTRQMILLILPLGSGIDDLIFFVVLAAIGAVLLVRVIPIRDKAQKIAKWLSK